jgi:hypothetical protein
VGLFIVREGEGEQEALPSLVFRLRDRLCLTELPFIPAEGNWKRQIVTESQVLRVCEQIRNVGSCEALLLTRDADNDDLPDADCPKFSAPAIAAWVRALKLPFPTAVVLFYKEYETLFLAGAEGMAGKEIRDSRGHVVETIPADVSAHPSPEYPRDAKGWVKDNLVKGYKPTLFQTSLTRLLDFDVLQTSDLSSYRRLLSALTFLAENLGVPGAVYPGSPEVTPDAQR